MDPNQANQTTTASGLIAFITDGREANGLHVVQIAPGQLRWTVAACHGRSSVTLTSDDPAIVAFVRRLLAAGQSPAA